MLSLLVAVPLSLIFWLFSVLALAAAIALCVAAVARVFEAAFVLDFVWGRFLGALLFASFLIWLALIVGLGAYGMGSHIIDSMIGRFTDG